MQSYIVTVNKEVKAPKCSSIDGEAFITMLPLQSRGDFSDIDVRGIQGELEVGPGGGNLVMEPGSHRTHRSRRS